MSAEREEPPLPRLTAADLEAMRRSHDPKAEAVAMYWQMHRDLHRHLSDADYEWVLDRDSQGA